MGKSKYFINAIESGVKGFLTKPIKNDHLEKIVAEQANDILLEKNLKEEEKKRIAAELGREKSDKILNSLSTVTATFFQQGLNESSILSGLKLIGDATESSRVVFFKFDKEDDQITASLQHIWRAYHSTKKSTTAKVQKLYMNTPMLKKWFQTLEANGNIWGNISEFDEKDRQIFKGINSKSILAIPIFVNEDLWGFISLDDIERERNWSNNEISALSSFAYNLGAAIYRKNAEQELIHMNVNLERRVKERTQALELEIVERSNTQEQLKESEEKYRLIYENASDGILLVQKGIIILINPTMVELMETMPRNLIGRPLHSFIKSSNKDIIETFFKSNETDVKKEESFEIMISTKNKKHKWLELKGHRNKLGW